MKSNIWFLCGRTIAASGDPFALLRNRLASVYTAERATEYSLVVVALGPESDGFDRLAMRLCCVRVLTDVTGSPAAVTGDGPALALIDRGRNLPATLAKLRMRLERATGAGCPPRVWLERLPADLPTAYELLDELSR